MSGEGLNNPGSWPARRTVIAMLLALAALGLSGCRSAGDYRREADRVAYDIIEQKQEQGLGKTEPFTIEPPAETLRRRLLIEQDLPVASELSLGTGALEPIEHWPNDDYLAQRSAELEPIESAATLQPPVLSLTDALQVAAANSRVYQTRKETVYRAALGLDLERYAFSTQFAGLIEGLFTHNRAPADPVTGVEAGAAGSVSQQFRNGAFLTSRIAVDLVKLLSQDRSSSLGLTFDSSISIPLLRGAGRHIAAEPLEQAERDALYAIWDFEQFKQSFAVGIARAYLNVLQQRNQVENAEENYRRLVASARRARRLSQAGRLPEVQVDQAVQDELRARSRWINAQQSYARQLDQFKLELGLPTDASIEMEQQTLDALATGVAAQLQNVTNVPQVAGENEAHVPPADAPVVLVEPRSEEGGPYEFPAPLAIGLGLEHRLDMRIAEGEVYDAQRRVVVAANGFLPELTLFGTVRAGEARSLGSAGAEDARLRFDRGQYNALLGLDLPLERTAERNIYRLSLINLERAVRDAQELEDQIKFQVRDQLRAMLESREGLRIQAQAVALAEQRVQSTNMLLEAGRAEIRDVLEAQEALISAQNALTAALVSYRVAELELQRDLGLLEVDETGLWREFDPSLLNAQRDSEDDV